MNMTYASNRIFTPAGTFLERVGMCIAIVIIGLAFASGVLQAGTSGKLSGRVLDKAGEPLPSANVLLMGTTLGAATDVDGYYNIINIPPGKYKVQFSLLAYRPVIVENISISSGATTKLNVDLEESAITQQTVIVEAKKPVVDISMTSSMVSLSAADIKTLPVQELSDLVNLQAGVVDGHFRGGRLDEVQYQVNGVTVNNSYDNTATVHVDRSLIQEVQVISGTFDAEYGQAMSGVVNAVLKTGSDHLNWNAEIFGGDYAFASNSQRIIADKFHPASLQNYQLSLSGPVPLPNTYFILSGQRTATGDYFYGQRMFLPTDRANFETRIFTPTGDGESVVMGYNNEWSGLAKITNKSLHGIEIGYQVLLDIIDGKRHDFAYRLDPDGLPTQHTFSIAHGLDWTQTLSNTVFYTLNLRQNVFQYHDYVYPNYDDPRYLAAGPPLSDPNYQIGAIVQGVDLNRFEQNTTSYVFKGSLTDQVTRDQQIKMGGEIQVASVEFGSPGYLVQTTVNGVQSLQPRNNDPPDYPAPQTYHPLSFAAYGQDQIEWNDLTFRAGLRADYFNARSTVPSDPANPANVISGAPLSVPQSTTPKFSLSPRLGVSYPITTKASIFFAYGHFYQMPGLGVVFTNSDYSILRNLQAGGVSYGVLGNPDIKPEKTVHYEFGYKHELTDFLGMDLSIFYKDIRDLLGVEFVSTYTAAEYARLTNIDFGSVRGFTISFDQRQIGMVSTSIDYTWQMAMGNSSDPYETATRASAGEDPRPRQVPLDWDQRHTLNFTVMVQRASSFSVSTVVKIGSGQPYTPIVDAVYGGGLETNSERKPAFVLIDLRAEKYFSFSGITMSLFTRIFNLLDTRSVNGFVFTDTGTPDYTRFAAKDPAGVADPTRFYTPRRVEVGITITPND